MFSTSNLDDARGKAIGPLVSIIIPTYNRPRLLTEAIGSALGQTYRHIEVVVSENAGPEVSEAVCRSFGDERVRYRRNARNLGIAGNIREASKCARGVLVAHLHDDDILEPEFVERLLPGMTTSNAVVVGFGDHSVTDVAGTIDPGSTQRFRRKWKRDQLSAGIHQPFLQIGLVNRSIAPTCLIRKDAVAWDDLVDEAGSTYDWYLWYLLGRDGGAANYVSEPVYRHRLHGGQETAARVRMGEGFLFCVRAVLEDPRVRSVASSLQDLLTSALAGHGMGLVRIGRRTEGRAALREALRRGAGPGVRMRLALSYAPWTIGVRDTLVSPFR